MNEKTQSYIKSRFSDYYRSVNFDNIPDDIENRELARITWTDIMIRHDALFTEQSISGYVTSNSPQHFYFSCGKYNNPSSEDMDKKEWIGSDLIFDLDADPEHMPMIDSDTSYKKSLEVCKTQLQKLIQSLHKILSPSNIHVFFSGSRGYHVHIRDESVQSLSRGARTELINLLTGKNISYDSITTTSKYFTETGKYFKNGYWGDIMYDTLSNKVEKINSFNSKEEKITYLQNIHGIDSAATDILEKVETLSNCSVSTDISVFPSAFIKFVINEAKKNGIVHIDAPVSSDTNRLIRVPDSLHGGSGLKVDSIPIDKIDSYDPLVEAVPSRFDNSDIQVKVTFTDDSKCHIGGTTREFSEDETCILDEEIAIHECCKNTAEVVEINV